MTGQPTVDGELPADEPLTTKEGWRRFVDYHPDPPTQLDLVAVMALSRPDRAALDDARRDYHGQLPLVNTPTIRQAAEHRAAAGPTQPRAGLRPPRPDPVWSVRHREDDGADSARPHPRARDPQAPPRPGRA